MSAQIELDVFDMVTELSQPHAHHEPYDREDQAAGAVVWSSHKHTTHVPPLLVQLEQSVGTSQAAGDDSFGGGFGSRLPIRPDVHDALDMIGADVERWLKRVDPGRVPPLEPVVALARLGGRIRSLEVCWRTSPRRQKKHEPACCPRHGLETDVRRWWTVARLMSGWDGGLTWQPGVACPSCEGWKTLRVRFAERLGLCTGCRETWRGEEFEHLGLFIREEYRRLARAGRVEACYCPWPNEIGATGSWSIGGRSVPMCPACASTRCHRAIAAGIKEPAA